ncbi:hypothetical protein ANO14919_000150 [Xylariales sp. No.14919]|nr:hypothetical protein ANO14919_000150 [Xylariales sp. No.14919]
MKGDMVAGGWNSLVISAACHLPNIEKGQTEQDPADETDNLMREGTETGYPEVSIALGEDEGNLDKSLHLSQRKLRWGGTEVPSRLTESISSEERAVFHLGFGGEEHNISEPKDGQYYV